MKLNKELEKKIRKSKVILVTGTPCTGKTTLAKEIAKKHGFAYLDVNKKIKEKKLYSSYDKKNKCYIVDEKKLAKHLEKLIQKFRKGKLIIDSHLSHYISPKFTDLCIVTACGLNELYRRLKKRSYPKKKIEDNMECEIMDVIAEEARQKGHKIIVVKTN